MSSQASPEAANSPSPFSSLYLPWFSLYAFLLMTLASPLPRLLSVFLLHFLMLRSMARWVLFIYGHALSVCVGLSNIHLSCAAIIQSLIPSHMWGMKYEHRSLLCSQFKVEGVLVCVWWRHCGAQHTLLRTTKRAKWSALFFYFLCFCNFLLAPPVLFFSPVLRGRSLL